MAVSPSRHLFCFCPLGLEFTWRFHHLVFCSVSAQDAFIGYGGNVVREKVKNNAGWFVTDFKELISALHGSAEQLS